MAKATARSIDNPETEKSFAELDETAPLPVMPDAEEVSEIAANDNAYTLTDRTTLEKLDSLVQLADSIDSRLEAIAAALASTDSTSEQGSGSKKTRRKKRRKAQRTS